MSHTEQTGLTAFQQSLDLHRIYVKGRLPADGSTGHRSRIRIVSWNIERGQKPPRIAAALAELQPDVACLQEVDWGNERTGSLDVLQYLAERIGMLGLFGVEFLEVCSPHRPARFAGGGATGNALLTRLAPISAFRVDLPPCLDWECAASNATLPSPVRWRMHREPRIGQRFGIGVELAIGKSKLVICSVHLEDKRGGVSGRWSQYTAALQAIETRCDASTVSIIAGDFNTFDCRLARFVTHESNVTALSKPAGVTEAAWWKMSLLPPTGYTDPFSPAAWTFSITPVFRAKLDWITIKGGTVLDCGVGRWSSSDHRSIWIDLEVDNRELDQ
jgi:endonuclease/exonuclease/phosphatase family metal-dependent hydrolase